MKNVKEKKEEMTTDIEFLELVAKVNKKQEAHKEFYDLAEKYGFCFPGCSECEICEEELVLTS